MDQTFEISANQNMVKFIRNCSDRFFRCVITLSIILVSFGNSTEAQTVPRISADDFSKMVTTFSEFGGFFPSNNWVSNELTYLNALESLEINNVRGGVYIGVGPDQNFVYISAIKPDLAITVDIRHQNTIQHLVYKALFELAGTRSEFLALLFSKRLDSDVELDADGNIETLVEYFSTAPSDRELMTKTSKTLQNILTEKYKFAFSERDRKALKKILNNFFVHNIEITYNGPRRSWYPTFGQLLRMRDTDGDQRNPFNSRDDYRYLRQMHMQNRIIPVTGDFSGSWSFHKISEYLRENFLSVSAFYTSNVEQYLLRNSFKWYGWSANVKQLPITDRSVFIRWTHDGGGYDQKTRIQWIHSFILKTMMPVTISRFMTLENWIILNRCRYRSATV